MKNNGRPTGCPDPRPPDHRHRRRPRPFQHAAGSQAVYGKSDCRGHRGGRRRRVRDAAAGPGDAAPGDIRNCMEALANTEPVMRELLHYRFTEGALARAVLRQSVLAALNGISPSL